MLVLPVIFPMLTGDSHEFGRIAAMDREEDLTDEIVMLRSLIRELTFHEKLDVRVDHFLMTVYIPLNQNT